MNRDGDVGGTGVVGQSETEKETKINLQFFPSLDCV